MGNRYGPNDALRKPSVVIAGGTLAGRPRWRARGQHPHVGKGPGANAGPEAATMTPRARIHDVGPHGYSEHSGNLAYRQQACCAGAEDHGQADRGAVGRQLLMLNWAWMGGRYGLPQDRYNDCIGHRGGWDPGSG